ncbi:hypothetical protein CQW23_32648 [Capsicum baccatum]|uniref:MBD domain-containing protein n=1 Tax=Capsicum baccatum TaxID=33114 RepID=A0A2G2V473_CAPBA|nr:hypothetical protein CQW23_32648 [Capsicum baccatum]
MHSPSEVHWKALKRVLRYLQEKLQLALHNQRVNDFKLHMYSDADWAGDSSRKQRTISHSSTEAEYRVAASALAETNWVTNLPHELHVSLPQRPTIYCDNVGATYLCANQVSHSRMKHIAVDFNFVRKQYYYDPVSGSKFQSKTEVLDFLVTGGKRRADTGGDATPSETRSSKKHKKSSSEKGKEKITYSYFDSVNQPESVCWVQMDSCADTCTPFIDGDMVPEGEREECDDGIPPDSSLQSETYISSETNATFETTKPEKADFVVEEGKEVDLATPVSVESESKMEVQMTKLVAEMVTPVHKVNRSVEVNVKRPSWMSEDWKFERIFHTNGASAGTVDIYYYEPVSGKKFWSMPEVLRFLKTGTMRKRSTGGDATSICWVLTDSSADTWAPFVHGNMVPEGQRQEWDAVFSTVSQRNANRDAGVSNVR